MWDGIMSEDVLLGVGGDIGERSLMGCVGQSYYFVSLFHVTLPYVGIADSFSTV